MENIRLMVRVENYEKYKEKIEKGPYIRQMDLAIFCSQLVHLDSSVMQTRHVTWELLNEWDISPETLFKKAGEDSRKYLASSVQSMETTIIDYMADEFLKKGTKDREQALDMAKKEYMRLFGEPSEEMATVYVVSNVAKIYGASVVFYEDVLKILAMQEASDLILLPSSIHEWLVMAENDESHLEDLESIVRDANHFVVREEEVLSNHVYRYSLKRDLIEMLCFTDDAN